MYRRKEMYWFIGSMVLILILNFIFFGSNAFSTDTTVDLNIHDTYFVIANIHLVVSLSVFLFFGIYLIRTLYRSFKNLAANIILMISIILLILIFTTTYSLITVLIQQSAGWTIYPPLSAGAIEHEIEPAEHYLGVLKNLVYGIQILLLILLAFCGYKTGRNYKQS
ncbi:hypothetical protein [Gelidibacter maritimus]|uniref:Uncharacterized protein n=1 Tax=Gelidibacter maritimus TaxID=2761487 RepID=A0A7W2M2N3_9FLAO|nr:hypothetical protein [Gelidibacter maritimus]MBA6151612.1 hypothetical protein [Gelidibacter maritimus]